VPDLLLVDRPSAAVALLTLDRPDKRNALSIALRDEVSDALDALAADEDVKAVVLTGAGEVFSAGFDLSEFTAAADDPALTDRLWASSDRFHHTVLDFPLPTIAAVNGPALAGGFDLAVLCDVRVASTTARFAHPEFTFAEVVYAPLHDLVGGAVARDLALTGRELTVDEALALHLVSEVVAPDEVVPRALAIADRTARAPRETLLRSKAKANRRRAITPDTPTLGL